MTASSTTSRAAPVAVSCLLHLAAGAAMAALGPAWPVRAPIAIVEADLVPAEPPPAPEPERTIARLAPSRPKPVVLPRPLDRPRREVVEPPLPEATPAPPPDEDPPQWGEDATAVRRRVLLRASADGSRTLGPVRALSEAVKAYAPDVKVTPAGDFLVAWHEERFPALRTVVRAVHARPGR